MNLEVNLKVDFEVDSDGDVNAVLRISIQLNQLKGEIQRKKKNPANLHINLHKISRNGDRSGSAAVGPHLSSAALRGISRPLRFRIPLRFRRQLQPLPHPPRSKSIHH